MKTTQIILGLLLLSFSGFSQIIIPQKSDTTKQKKELEYFGDDKEDEEQNNTPAEEPKQETPQVEIEEAPVRTDSIPAQPVIIKYYEATESSESEEDEKPRRNKNQIKTLTGKMSHSGGYGAVSFKSSNFNGKTLVMGGLRGAWVVNRTLAIGVDMYGIIPTTKYDNIDPDNAQRRLRILGGYGGLMLEPIFFSNEVVHITFPVSAGAGWLGYEDPDINDFRNDTDDLVDDDVFWYIEPGANLEVNIARNFRIDLGVSKRFTQDLQLVNTPSDEFDEVNYYLTLKIGRF